MITIYIDNKPHQVAPDQNLLQACLSLGFDLPYFCWHPAMHSVGACRQCAVKQYKDEQDTRGRIVMSCMTPVAEGIRISIDDPEAVAFRAGVLEWLMLNHPHDCPVCDEGGECHLQDMTVMTGHAYRRTRFPKRTHRNQYLGPFINHEMNRCIQCYRCVRFYRGYAGGRDLNVFASHDHVYFGRAEDGALESEFSGNLVEICPTGVFTDKTLKEHYTRKWDLQTAPSICVHCGLGCNTIAGERYGTLRRILNRYHSEVNGYFLCDRGRFGYGFVNSEKRINQPLLSPSLGPSRQGRERSFPPLSPGGSGQGEGAKAVSKKDILKRVSEMLSAGSSVIGIGSPRASLESNFALRTLVGPQNFVSGMSAAEQRLIEKIIHILTTGPARTPSLSEAQRADAVLVLGEDVTNTAPLLGLALRQAVRQKGFSIAAKVKIPAWDDDAVRHAAQDERSPLYIATSYPTKLDDVAAGTFRAAADDLARMGLAVAHELDQSAPAVSGLPQEIQSRAKEIAEALRNADRPLVVSGVGCRSEAVIEAAANIAWALRKKGKKAQLCYAVHECNTMGLGMLGGRSLDSLFSSPSPPVEEGGPAPFETKAHLGREGRIDTLIILENDLSRRTDANLMEAVLARANNIIIIDHLMHATALKADIILPAATFAEADGTLVNSEGRAQRFYQVFVPQGDVQASWKWIDDIMIAIGRSAAGERTWDSLMGDLAAALPRFGPMRDHAPSADFRISGLKVPRQPHRYSGRTAMIANITVHEPKPAPDPDTPLSFSMEGYEGRPPSALIPRYWAPGWNSVQALNKFQQEVGGPLAGGDPGTRLIEPGQGATPPYFDPLPVGSEPPEPAEYRLFGSEELSMYAEPISERARE